MGVVAADFDYDYRTDLLLAGAAGVKLLRQDDGGRFVDVTGGDEASAAALRAPAFGAWAADVDTDGDLDVVLAPLDGPPVVLRNNGDGTFAERRPFAGRRPRCAASSGPTSTATASRTPRCSTPTGAVHVLLNLRGGVFREEPLPAGAPEVVALADCRGDWRRARSTSSASPTDGALVRLSLAEDRRRLETPHDRSRLDGAARGPGPGHGPAAGGRPRQQRRRRPRRGRNGGLARPARRQREGLRAARRLRCALGARAAADLDGDGRLELLGVADGGRAVRAKSRGTKAYRWQALRPRSATATGDQRINSFGIGGEVELRTGLHVQKRTIDAPVVHFGLGEATRADVVRVIWPNGVIQSEFDTRADATVAATQRLKGSCPWLFAWNGREMAFVTDLIWRSPLGLRINAQQTADVLMTEDWVKVRGDQLVAARRRLRPARHRPSSGRPTSSTCSRSWSWTTRKGTEVFVDERFAVPPPKLAVHVTGPVRELRAARDDRGRDVSDVVRARDGRHLDFAGRGAYQGITRDHFVELELPEDAPRSGPLWLVGQGWVHPTDSSINVAISQGAHAAAARACPCTWPTPAGRFRKVRDGPGLSRAGKDKTVLLDLAGLFPAKRAAAAAARDQPRGLLGPPRLGGGPARRAACIPRRAALRLGRAALPRLLGDRAGGRRARPSGRATSSPARRRAGWTWRATTRASATCGELLRRVDDRYVIMNAGDELRLRFARGSAAPRRPRPRLRARRRRLGQGRRLQHDLLAHGAAPAHACPAAATTRAAGHAGGRPGLPAHPRDFEEYHTRYVSPDGRARHALVRGDAHRAR